MSKGLHLTSFSKEQRLEELKESLKSVLPKLLKEFIPKVEGKNGNFPDKYVSRQEVMKAFQLRARSSIWQWENKGKLTPYKIGRRVFYLREEVDKIIEKARCKAQK